MLYVGLVCHCTPGFELIRDVNPCEQENITDSYTRVCGIGGVCLVRQLQDWFSKRIIQYCAYDTPYNRESCAQHDYNTVDGGKTLCCVKDHCNSIKHYFEFRVNLSATTTNNVGQVATSTSMLISATSYNVGKVTSSTNNLTSTTSLIPTATIWIPTASPTGEFIL